MTLLRGVKIGAYEIVSPFSRGGTGEVYLAKDLKLGRDAAIKVFKEGLASEPERMKRFEQEARSASALNHPNIITVYDIGVHNASPFIAMELIEGRSLRDILSAEPLPNSMLLDYTTQLANGLARANAAGIVHGALMPENLMVTSDESVKILDFGLGGLIQDTLDAELVKDITRTEMILGSMAYMSPEQVSGRKVGFRSDQFSFGAIVYEMASAKAAFRRKTASQTLTAIIEDEPEPITHLNPDVTTQLPTIVSRCLDKRPDARYGSTQELYSELKRIPKAPSSFTTLMEMLRTSIKKHFDTHE